MRDPMNWALPIFRAFGIQVRVHLLFFIITLGLFLRQISIPGNVVWWGDVLMFTVFLLFGIILLHEFGHCFGGRAVGGEAEEILIWPLGGLAFVNVPHNWKAHSYTVAAGPFVNVVLCVLAGSILAGAGYFPMLSPVADPYVSEMRNFKDDKIYTSQYGMRLYVPRTDGVAEVAPDLDRTFVGKPADLMDYAVKSGYDRALAPGWIVWLNRTFWLSWILLLLNLIPAYPLDGGQLLQGIIWGRRDFRTGVTVAAYTGYVCSVFMLIASIASNETMLLGLGLFMLFSCALKLKSLEAEEGPFGYDFSAGYTSLDKDEEDENPKPRPKKQGFLKRWMQARTAKRLRQEAAQRQQDDERMDQLLEKIARTGKQSLTDDDRRFMERVSARYRNK